MTDPMNHQGYLGNLEKMTTVELRDLLYRQETLLKKPKFLNTLPDKGEKVIKFAETLQNLLKKREKTQEHFSALGERTQFDNVEKINGHEDHKTTISEKHIKRAGLNQSRFKALKVTQSKSMDHDNTGGMELKQTSEKLDQDIVVLNSENSSNTDATMFEAMDETARNSGDLEEVFEKMAVGDGVSMEAELDGQCRNKHQFEIAEDRAERNKSVLRPEYKPYSSLKIHNVQDLPEKFKPPEDLKSNGGKSSTAMEDDTEKVHEEEEKLSHRQHVGDGDSSATPPVYKFETVKLISLQESLDLQRQQKSSQEELQAKIAAERLADRMDIKLDQYNPEGVDMSYRVKDADIDSDDEEEADLEGVD